MDVVVCIVKGSEATQAMFSVKSRVEIIAIHCCMLELVFFKLFFLTLIQCMHVADHASEPAFIWYLGADEISTGSPPNSV